MKSKELNQLAGELISDANSGNYKKVIIHSDKSSFKEQLTQHDFAVLKSTMNKLAPNLIVEHCVE